MAPEIQIPEGGPEGQVFHPSFVVENGEWKQRGGHWKDPEPEPAAEPAPEPPTTDGGPSLLDKIESGMKAIVEAVEHVGEKPAEPHV